MNDCSEALVVKYVTMGREDVKNCVTPFTDDPNSKFVVD